MGKFRQFYEARVLNTDFKKTNREQPIMFGDTVRVYHGFNRTYQAYKAATQGLSGKEYAKRIYSFESNNNPKGLFVSSSLQDAKEFTGAYENISAIAEIHANEKDLEVPVWPGGSYTGFGGYSEYWSNDPEENASQRKEAQREKSQWVLQQAEKQGLDWILKSDRPDLAWFLQMGMENQALFIGDLNPNSIRTFWVQDIGEDGHHHKKDPFYRVSRKEFISKIKSEYSEDSLKGDKYETDKIFQPREEFTVEKLVDRMKYFDSIKNAEEKMKFFVDSENYTMENVLGHYLWPKQLEKAQEWWDSLKDK